MIKLYEPSPVRVAQQLFEERIIREKRLFQQNTSLINVAIGNVSLPTHPKLLARLKQVSDPGLLEGIWRYSSTSGHFRANKAFSNIIRSFLNKNNNPKLFSLITDGSSTDMDMIMDLLCGTPYSKERPLLVIEPIYGNYPEIASSRGYPIVAVTRKLNDDGSYTRVEPHEIEEAIRRYKPGALLIIPADNPSGQLTSQDTIKEYTKICLNAKDFLGRDLYIVEDAAYRGLYYTGNIAPSIWHLTNNDVPGIEEAKIRVSLESLSKTFNACGLRSGALVSDNEDLIKSAINNRTIYLCSNVIMQYITGALAEESHEDIQNWLKKLRSHYLEIIPKLHKHLMKELPTGTIVSKPESSLYLVVDFKRCVDNNFNASDFVRYCAIEGKVGINGIPTTVLTSPMSGFYIKRDGQPNPGDKQIRISCVETDDKMGLVAPILAKLLKDFLNKKKR